MRKFFKSAGSLAIAGLLALSMSIPAFAATTAETNDLANQDIIEQDRTGSITIYKYDMTTAENDGIYDPDENEAGTGLKDTTFESTMADYVMPDIVFTYLRLGDVEEYSLTSGTTTTNQVVYEIPTALADILGLTSSDAIDMSTTNHPCTNSGVYHYTSDQLNEALQDILTNGNTAAKNALENYVESTSGSVTMTETDVNGMTTTGDIAVGLYLFVETAVPETVIETVNPFLVSMPQASPDGTDWNYDVTVYPKNESGNPTIDKLVRSATGEFTYNNSYRHNVEDTSYVDGIYNASDNTAWTSVEAYMADHPEYTFGTTVTATEGEVLDYIVVNHLPKISSEATYLTTVQFDDSMSAGLDYKDFYIAIYDNAEAAMVNDLTQEVELWDEDSGMFTVSHGGALATGETATVALTANGLAAINPTYSEYYLVLFYQVDVISDQYLTLGDNGNPNDVVYTWHRTNDSDFYYDTLEDECIVYSYGVNLAKTFSDNSTSYEDVQFVVYDVTDGNYLIATGGTNGVYYVSGNTTDEDYATQFTPGSDGTFVINGMEADTYAITEIHTASGFSLLETQIIVTINESTREIVASYITSTESAKGVKTDMAIGELTSATAAVDGTADTMTADGSSANAYVNLAVTNTKGFTLPTTGGTGSYLLGICGVIVVIAGVAGCVYGVMKKRNNASAE